MKATNMEQDRPVVDRIAGFLRKDSLWFLQIGYLVPFIAMLVNIRAWSFYSAPEHMLWVKVEQLTLIAIVISLFISPSHYVEKPRLGQFAIYPILFLLFTFTSFLPLFYITGQSFLSSMNANYNCLYWLTYFVFHRHRVQPERLMKLVSFIGLTWVAITLIQQVTYPHYLFFSRVDDWNPDQPIEMRAGILRYMVDGVFYAVLTGLYFFNRFLVTGRLWMVGINLMTLVGIYFHGTRQVIAAMLGCMVASIAIYFSRKRGQSRISYVLGITVIVLVLAIFFEQIFGKFVEISVADATEDNIRIASAHFFLFDYWHHWTCFFLGNGMPRWASPFGQEIQALCDNGFYQTDVGLIGVLSIYGLFFLLTILAMYAHVLFRKYPPEKLFVHITFLFVAMIGSVSGDFVSGGLYPVLGVLWYLTEQHIDLGREAKGYSFSALPKR